MRCRFVGTRNLYENGDLIDLPQSFWCVCVCVSVFQDRMHVKGLMFIY